MAGSVDAESVFPRDRLASFEGAAENRFANNRPLSLDRWPWYPGRNSRSHRREASLAEPGRPTNPEEKSVGRVAGLRGIFYRATLPLRK